MLAAASLALCLQWWSPAGSPSDLLEARPEWASLEARSAILGKLGVHFGFSFSRWRDCRRGALFR